MKTKYRFIHFEEHNTFYGRRYYVKNNKQGSTLGEIEFYEDWDEWIYSPVRNIVLSYQCLIDITDFLKQLKSNSK